MNATARMPDSGADIHPLVEMAFQIADSAARSDIECECAHHSGNAETGWWYDTSKLEGLSESWRPDIELSIEYCERRNLLVRMPGALHVVRFIQRTAP